MIWYIMFATFVMSVAVSLYIKKVDITNSGVWSYRNSQYSSERNHKHGFDTDYLIPAVLIALFGFITLPLLLGWLLVNYTSDFLLDKFIQKDVNDSISDA